jgi:hypothetical protein
MIVGTFGGLGEKITTINSDYEDYLFQLTVLTHEVLIE